MPKQNSILALLTVLLVIAVYFVTQIQVYHDLEAFFPSEDPELDFYEEHITRFKADDNFIFIAIENKPSIFDSVFLQKVIAFTEACDTIAQTQSTSSLTNIKDVLYTSIGPSSIPVLHPNNPEKYATDSTRIFNDERLVGRYISKNADALSIVIFHKDGIVESEARRITNSVDEVLQAFNFQQTYLAGRAHTVRFVVDTITSEFLFYIAISIILTLLVMGILLRRFWGVVVSLAAVIIALILFMGLLGATGKSLDIMSPLFPTLMIVVGMSDVIHIMSKYLDEINKGLPKKAALEIAIKEIGLATFLTSFTTAIGFATLSATNIVAIKSFGIYAAIGVLLTYVAVIAFAYAVLLRFKPTQLTNMQQHGAFWDRLMLRMYDFSFNHQRKIALGGVAVLIISLIGIAKMPSNVFMLDDVPTNGKLRSDFLFFEKEFEGVRVFEVAAIVPEGKTAMDLDVLQEMEKFNQYINTIPEVGTLYSPLTIYKSLHKANNGGLPQQYQLPNSSKLLKKYDRQLKKAGAWNQLDLLISEDKKYSRMTANMQDLGSEKIALINQQIIHWIQQNIQPEIVQLKLTGTALLVDKNHHYLRSSLFTGLAIAFLLVSIIMSLLFRDVKMVLISLIPNVFPLLICGAIMGFLGINLKASTSIIFTVAFGIAVDDTIHFLSKFKLQLRKGNTTEDAIRTTFLETGKALCLTTFILSGAFLTLITSNFGATYYIGLLVSITLFTALLADLTLLPVCLRWMRKGKD